MFDLAATVSFLQDLIRTESLPGREGEIASRVESEMRSLGYDEVGRDGAGNVLGRVRGRGTAPTVMFNTHLDHVDVGDPAAWPYPPMQAEIHDDKVWGRGAVDIKGPLAAQVHGVGSLLRSDRRPAGDLLVSAVVQEEIGGLGARHLARTVEAPWVVVGEPSRNTLRRGHRGRAELHIVIRGKSAHASVPREGVSPYPVLAGLVNALDELEMRSDPDLGSSTVALTLIQSDQASANVIPSELRVTCDCRIVPGESADDLRRRLQTAAESHLTAGASVEVTVPVFRQESYTGLGMEMPADNPAYILRSDHPLVTASREALRGLVADEAPGVWHFATDGGHFAVAGMAPIGFGPGDELLAHTVREHIEIAELEAALEANRRLARHLPRALATS